MIRLLRTIFRSLFTKLAAVMILAVIGINVITYSLYVGLQYGHETTLNRSLVQYALTLAEEIGSPPDKLKAERLARERRMRITVSGERSWVVGNTTTRFPAKFLQTRFSADGVEVYSLHGFYRVRVRADANRVLTFDLFPTEAERAAERRYALISLFGSCFVMLVVYLALRWFLRPIGWLTKGAASVRDGALDCRVPEKSSGELRALTETFNQMVARLESMVEGQQQLLLGVSHELRTPLTRLKLRLEMMDSATEPTAFCGDIRQMESMITSLLDAARMRFATESLRKRRIDMVALLSDVAQGYGEQHPGVKLALSADKAWLEVDPDQMLLLLSTLLDNAIKYSREDSNPIELSLGIEDNSVVIAISDSGIGIPEEALKHLFEPFYRVDESRTRQTGGYGLGLYLCHAVAEAHGAEIKVTSRVDVGTTVTLIMPISIYTR